VKKSNFGVCLFFGGAVLRNFNWKFGGSTIRTDQDFFHKRVRSPIRVTFFGPRSSSSSPAKSEHCLGNPQKKIIEKLRPCGFERASNSAVVPVISASRKISSSRN
jgi:hypothetical protein